MKKFIFSLSLFLSFSTLVHAQWTTNGTVTTTTNAIGIGTTIPQSILHISGTGTSINQSSQVDSRSVLIQAITGGRGVATGAQIEFAIPANTDGSNIWGQARIVAVAGNSNNNDATGKMILGTRRMFNKIGAGATWYYGDDLAIDGTGNVGIGTTTPTEKLSITGGNLLISNATWYSSKNTSGTTVSLLGLASDNNMYMGDLFGNNSAGNLILRTNGSDKMMINSNGNISIGTNDSKGYKFAVNGSAIATSVTVKAAGTWPDYVFKKDYQLLSLQDVKAYIDQNQHLPEIPSEQQIARDGLNLGEMNTLLMKKMEEMTLYMIEAKEEINELKKQVQDLKRQIK